MITNARFSFFQFSTAVLSSCFALPVLRSDQIIMQINSDANDLRVSIVDEALNVIAQGVSTNEEIMPGVWSMTVTIPDTITKNKCYRLLIEEVKSGFCAIDDFCSELDVCGIISELVYVNQMYSNPFRVIYEAEEKYTNIIRYTNSESFAGFVYDENGSYLNQIRVPILVRFPQMLDEIETYRNSKGEYDMISASSELEYQIDTDFADEHFHFCFRNALLHDYFFVNGSRLFNFESYEIAWTKTIGGIKIAKAGTKVRLSPYDVINPNYSANELEFFGFSIGFSDGFNG